jgi:hypothetical protein
VNEYDLKNTSGRINVHTRTRGSLQYVIDVTEGKNKNSTYFPVNLEDKFKVEGLEILFDAEILDSTIQIYKPGPTDIPEPDFMVKAIKLESINEIKK